MEVINRNLNRQTHSLRFNNLIFIVLLLAITVSSIKLETRGSDLDDGEVSEYAMVLADQDDTTQSKAQKKAEQDELNSDTPHIKVKIKEHNNLELKEETL